jgi:hypothetical protein
MNDDMMKADGFNDAIIGVGSKCGSEDSFIYSTDKVLEILMSQGMAEDQALEYFYFNILGAYVGETTPIFMSEIDDDA